MAHVLHATSHRKMIAPLVARKPFTEAAIENQKRRLRLELARIEGVS